MARDHASPRVDGAAVRRCRQEFGLNVTTLAKRMKISTSYLSQIEHGHRPTVSPKTFNRLLAALKVTDRAVLLVAGPEITSPVPEPEAEPVPERRRATRPSRAATRHGRPVATRPTVVGRDAA